jgi:hypothetical protein
MHWRSFVAQLVLNLQLIENRLIKMATIRIPGGILLFSESIFLPKT